MGTDPVFQSLTPSGFGIGVVAGFEHRHKQRGLPHGTALRVVDRNRGPCKINEELLAGRVLLA